MDTSLPMFYIGHHETTRALPVTDELVQHAQDCGYDMLTTPITNAHFHTRVLSLLSSYSQSLSESNLPLSPHPLPLIPALESVDTSLHPSETVSQLVTFTSSWIDLASPDPIIAHLSRQVLHLEIAYAAFCGVVTVVIPGPRLAAGTHGLSQYARAVKEALNVGSYLQLHIMMPMDNSTINGKGDNIGDLARFVSSEYATQDEQVTSPDPWASWEAWNTTRTICRYSSRLSICLELPRRLPSVALQCRWYSEPVRLLNIPASSFLVNSRGYPVLSKPHQQFILRIMRLKNSPWILLTDIGPLPGVNDPELVMDYPSGHLSPGTAADAQTPSSSMSPSPTPAEASRMTTNGKTSSKNDPTPHRSYLLYLQRNQPSKSRLEGFGGGFQDYLQSPLQPLTDNLESITYEVFEKDPVKYDWYESAITQALRDWESQNKSTSSEDGAVVVAVVGAGRGPLVTRALKASEAAGVPIQAFAIEKNPNAYVHLTRHNQGTWGGRVTVVKTDMRAWKGPSLSDGTFGKVDILVSELLGSFADNELSPECLDGVQHVLNPDHGISIPISYTAHMTPISTPRIYGDLIMRSGSADADTFDIPWVVMLQQFDFLSVDRETELNSKDTKITQMNLSSPLIPLVQTAWEFSHPIPATIMGQASLRRGGSAAGGGGGFTGGDGANEHNNRFCKLTFPIQARSVCHGLGGYFETVLYSGSEGPVELSTNPVTMDQKSEDMISWFPIFFPLKTPLQLPEESELDISMWRQTDDRKVWYEWLVESFVTLKGKRMCLGISELHSSKSNGCLM
ncbi:arginine N-methyltransferas-like protein [Polyplosphaeria fusca]|uniref:Protein arginine N-methyltransferase n=1 Tax=Polyplosphaeria fusca TaxID=682080 RepID=A0A9P4UX90_9PLEO|nr:arginine N-methyltransferas-like protein [Polyplosphaeria fusca]